MQPLVRHTGIAAVLMIPNIDTDTIIPSRAMSRVSREGLGRSLFANWRYRDTGGNEPDPGFVLNQAPFDAASILITDRNFGCGSSREHAPWALLDYGFEAVISTEIADIFRNNALKNGLVAIVVDEDTHGWLLDNPGAELVIDVENTTITLPDGRNIDFTLDKFARYCLVAGLDQLGFLQKQLDTIECYEKERAWKP